jgi:hypothetical protein
MKMMIFWGELIYISAFYLFSKGKKVYVLWSFTCLIDNKRDCYHGSGPFGHSLDLAVQP